MTMMIRTLGISLCILIGVLTVSGSCGGVVTCAGGNCPPVPKCVGPHVCPLTVETRGEEQLTNFTVTLNPKSDMCLGTQFVGDVCLTGFRSQSVVDCGNSGGMGLIVNMTVPGTIPVKTYSKRLDCLSAEFNLDRRLCLEHGQVLELNVQFIETHGCMFWVGNWEFLFNKKILCE